jgi:hypothetical protein
MKFVLCGLVITKGEVRERLPVLGSRGVVNVAMSNFSHLLGALG